MSPATATVSTIVRPRRLIPIPILLLLFLTCTATGVAEPVKVKFVVSPEAEVFVMGSEGFRSVGLSSRVEALELEEVELSEQRELIPLKYRVPLWFGKSWESETEFVKLTDLLKAKRIPLAGVLELPLTSWQRLQAAVSFPLFLLLTLMVSVFFLKLLKHRRRAVGSESTAIDIRFATFADVQLIGQGGMGEVFKAKNSRGELVAIKSLRPELSQQQDFRRRFNREMSALSQLEHPNLLRFESEGIDAEGRLFVVTEFLDGHTLKEEIQRKNYVPPRLACEVIEQIGSCLQYIHDNGMLHRDVKPDNIFVCKDGTLKLMDLGLVGGDEMTALTMTGQVMGTPAYVAPEQVENEPRKASDQYSLGVVLYEILTGRRPFQQTKAELLIYQHLRVVPEALSEIEPRIPADIEAAVMKMLEKEPAERFASVEEARQALSDKLLLLKWDDETDDTDTFCGSLDPS